MPARGAEKVFPKKSRGTIVKHLDGNSQRDANRMKHAFKRTASALFLLTVGGLTSAPAMAQSKADICETYWANYAREQQAINRMKPGPYKTGKQHRLNKKRARLEHECAGKPQVRSGGPGPGRVATGVASPPPTLPGYAAGAVVEAEAYERLEQHFGRKFDALRRQQIGIDARFDKATAGCGSDKACLHGHARVRFSQSRAVDRAFKKLERAYVGDTTLIQRYFAWQRARTNTLRR